MNILCEETMRRIKTTPLTCPSTIMSLMLTLNIQLITFILSIIDLILSSDLCTLLKGSNFHDIANAVQVSRFLFADGLDYHLFTKEHMQPIILLLWYMNRISTIKGANAFKPDIDEMIDQLELLLRESDKSLKGVSDSRKYSIYEMKSIAGTTVDMIGSLSILLTSTCEFFDEYVPACSMILHKWIGYLYCVLILYSLIPSIHGEEDDLKVEMTWKTTIRSTRRCVDDVVWYEGLEIHRDYVLDCLDRLTVLMYSLIDRY